MDTRQELIERSIPFLYEARNRTAGSEMEAWLNTTYGPGTAVYEDLARLIKAGVQEGWAANVEVGGPHYRRSLVQAPCEASHYFSITAVYMSSEARFRGGYHAHPYGEVNMVVPVDRGAQLMGPDGWSGAGWTAPGPASHHYPEIRGGALISLVFLPAGRIDIRPAPEAGDTD